MKHSSLRPHVAAVLIDPGTLSRPVGGGRPRKFFQRFATLPWGRRDAKFPPLGAHLSTQPCPLLRSIRSSPRGAFQCLNHSYRSKTAVELGVSFPPGVQVSPAGYGFELNKSK